MVVLGIFTLLFWEKIDNGECYLIILGISILAYLSPQCCPFLVFCFRRNFLFNLLLINGRSGDCFVSKGIISDRRNCFTGV